ncbi:hypothetical protein HWV62_37719 [Athelia sp. TMB]|nr:hypothetical protein HWV62_37719 [Athelia sp. TMB]
MSFAESEDSPVIDCDVLEAAKENIQPLASGRRVTSLSAVLSTPHAQREVQHSSVKSRHRINIQLALEDVDDPEADPLEAYCAFVYWTVEAYPQGQSAESGLLELLEEATRVLKDDRSGKWRGELRYLKLWVLYASFVEKPTIVYRFLLANDIGSEHALLYEEYAAVLERNGRRVDADEAYTLGVARNAQPIERLKSKHREFQKRMMSAATSQVSAPPPQPTTTTAPSAGKRKVLGQSRAMPSSSTLAHDDVFTVPSAPTSQETPNARLQVFVDPSPATSSTVGDEYQTPYPDIGTRKTRVKENVPEIKKAGGTTLKQAGKTKRVASGSGMAGGSRIAVFRDPGEGAPSSALKGGFAIFQDASEDVPSPLPTTNLANASTRKVSASSSQGGFAIFQDSESGMPPPPIPTKLPATKPRGSGIEPYRDEPAPPTPTGAFTPFRDEAPETPSRSHTPSASSPSGLGLGIPESVMKLKASKGKGMGGVETSEAEALRRDPLKNYGNETLGLAAE